MNIRQPKTVKAAAREQLLRADQLPRIMLIFCGILLALCTLVTLGNYLLDHLMSQSGGLGQLSRRSMLATFQTLLPVFHTLVLMALELGLLNAMLRISRGQYASPQSLRMGLSRFWVLLRCTLLQLVVYLALAMFATNIAMVIFFMTPLSNASMELLEPLMATQTDPNVLVNTLMADEAMVMAFLRAVLPMYVVLVVVLLGLMIPVFYRFRAAHYILVENPKAGAFRALTESFRITRGNCMAFFKLDVSFWFYHVLGLAATALSYGDLLLPALGISLPWSGTAASLIFYGLYLVGQCAIYYFLRPQVEVSSALIYNAIRPREEPSNQVVLGNIFQM